MKRPGEILMIAALCAALPAAFILLELRFQAPDAAISLKGSLSATQSKAVDVFTGLVSLFISFGLALIGAVGLFVMSTLKGEFLLPRVTLGLLAGSGFSSILAIFFGHLVYSSLAVMLANDILEFHHAYLVWPMRLQYITLLLALSFFVVAVLLAATRRDTRAPATGSAPRTAAPSAGTPTL